MVFVQCLVTNKEGAKLTTLITQLTDANLVDTVKALDKVTVFGPTDDAFSAFLDDKPTALGEDGCTLADV